MRIKQRLFIGLLGVVAAVYFYMSGGVLYLMVWPINMVLDVFLPEKTAYQTSGVLGVGVFAIALLVFFKILVKYKK